MNQLGSAGRRTTDQGYRTMASERGAWRPVGGPAPQYQSQPPYQSQQPYQPQPQWQPQARPQWGPQNGGPQNGGPQNGGPQNPGPRRPGPQQPMPGPARPPMGPPPAAPVAPVAGGPPAPRRRGRVGRWIAAGVVVAALGGVGWYVTFGAPAPVTAVVGDCVAQTGENDVKVVGCGEPSAQFRVAGKVEDKTMIAASLFACSDFPTATSSFWQGEQDKPGTVLCLAPLHP